MIRVSARRLLDAAVVRRRAGSHGWCRRLCSVAWSDWRSRTGTAIVVGFVILAAAAPAITAVTGVDPYSFDASVLDGNSAPRGPFGGVSAEHWLGVEPLSGRDLFAITVEGARTSLGIALAAAVITMTIATIVGLVAGYAGGMVDRITTTVTGVLFGFPSLLFMIALGAVVPVGFSRPLLVVLVISAFGWAGTARVIRNHAVALRHTAYVQSAKLSGAGPIRIVLTEMLPNSRSLIVVFATLAIPGLVGTEASLSFLGVGVPPPTPSWGRTIADSINWISTDPWYLLFPGIALFVLTWGSTLLGDAVRDALEPGRRAVQRPL